MRSTILTRSVLRTAALTLYFSSPLYFSLPMMGGSLIAIDYNSATNENEIRQIFPVTGSASLLSTLQFSSGGFFLNTFTTDPVSGQFYAQASDNTLFAFSLYNGQIQSTAALNVSFETLSSDGSGPLIGIDYDYTTATNELRAVNALTGATTLLNSFAFDSGSFFTGTLVVSGARTYVESSDNLLYTFDTTTGQIVSTITLDYAMQALADAGNGLLIGIDFNSTSELNEIRTIDPQTGATSALNAFAFGGGGWSGLALDPALGLLYTESADQTLYTLSSVSGQIVNTAPTAYEFEGLGLGAETPEPASWALLGGAIAAMVAWATAIKTPSNERSLSRAVDHATSCIETNHDIVAG